jgi:[glutamine synthetase] adenylyltransferase / [glutamine synthetase]-adenylyl-L-tyrosine phosphorylase
VNERIENLTRDLPDAASAQRFFAQLQTENPREAERLMQREKNQGLLADVLALAAWSGFLATTLLQHPEYFAWLNRKRGENVVRGREELLESLARFSLTNSSIEPHVLLARFRRRELLRIYLNDIRNLTTVAETTEELSNLADACLEHALRIARQEVDNRFGAPLEIDERGKARTAQFAVVALGKLGSRELNYASDIDLLFLYSSDGATSGTGAAAAHGAATNKEYFVKLAERLTRIIGAQSNEGAAYRVDLRLRPHGRVGALAVSVAEAANYYRRTARDWERQVLLRARSAAGDAEVFRAFWTQIETFVYQTDVSVETALTNVRLSKQQINFELNQERGFNVKLGTGGIREIEFLAQALQLAHGGRDAWLRAPHTLIALRRLADRSFLSESELAALSDAYAFLRRLEHRLQMEHGLQTHAVPDEPQKRKLIAARMNFATLDFFNEALSFHTENVNRIFQLRIAGGGLQTENQFAREERAPAEPLISVLETEELQTDEIEFEAKDYFEILTAAVERATNFHDELAALRIEWKRLHEEILRVDKAEKISLVESCKQQTALAEAGIKAALKITEKQAQRRFDELRMPSDGLGISVLGLGKLGSGGMDWGSDLDLILIYDDRLPNPVRDLSNTEFYGRASEIFVAALSSLTREGYLYRVDLRLRPDGKNGASVSAATAFLDYAATRAAVWEWLAYVKLRAAGGGSGDSNSGGDAAFPGEIERRARQIIHERAQRSDREILKTETRKVRERLEVEKTKNLRRGMINIKHGAGGLLDVYFAVRFLQLRDAVFDSEENRSTSATLEKLRAAGSLDADDFKVLSDGYEFLRRIDHALRLASGRATPLPAASHPLLESVAARLKISENELLERLAFHQTCIRQTFDSLLS